MKLVLVFSLGGLLYSLIEILWRGWTHLSMFFCGGLCFCIMFCINRLPLRKIKKYILSSAAIVTVEFYAGCILNIALKLQIWDYSAKSFNLLGQICPEYLFFWFLLSIPGIKICDLIDRPLKKAQ